MAVFFAIAIVLRRSPGSIVPWLGVLAFEIVNELVDIFHWHDGAFSFEVGDAFKDLINTMLWPTVITAAVRLSCRKRAPGDRPLGRF